MIETCKYYPKQMNGPVLSANCLAVNEECSDAVAIEEYLHDLSIDTAQETELENIGRIIGYLRPVVPEGFDAENILLLGTLPLAQEELIGLSTTNSQIGGELSTVVLSQTNYMDLGTYRKFLKSMAILKRYGITLKSVDKIASLVSLDYTLEFSEDADVIIHFTHNIGYKNLWILTQLFYRIALAPQVLILSEE